MPEARTSLCGLLAVMSPVNATFPRLARVRTGAEYRRVFEGARRCADPLFALHWLTSENAPRLGLAVSRKVDKHAVGRNRIKRQLREHFRSTRSLLSNGDYVVVARAAAAQASAQQLRESFVRLLVRAGALPASAADVTMPRTLNSPSSPTKPVSDPG